MGSFCVVETSRKSLSLNLIRQGSNPILSSFLELQVSSHFCFPLHILWHDHFKPFLTCTVHWTFHSLFVWNMYHRSQIYLAEPCIASMTPCLYSCWHLTQTSLFCSVVYIQKIPQEFMCKACLLPLSYFISSTIKWIFNQKEKMRLSSTYFLLVNFKNYLFSCILPLFLLPDFFPIPYPLSQAFLHCLNQRSFVMSTPKIWKNNVKRFWVFIHHCRFVGNLLACMGSFETPAPLITWTLLNLSLRHQFPCMFSFSRSHKLVHSLISDLTCMHTAKNSLWNPNTIALLFTLLPNCHSHVYQCLNADACVHTFIYGMLMEVSVFITWLHFSKWVPLVW